MKIAAYALTALAAVGIIIALATTPVDESPAETALTESTSKVPAAEQLVSLTKQAGSVTLEVPSMHCQFACYPKVKDSLENNDLVKDVELVEQPDPNALSVKKVVVTYEAGFDLVGAMAKLDKAGFSVTDVIQ